ncbi:hypothetical protein NZK35_07770 [Stieleria sp. ICT_E10.1]|uniref:hypothetical protein n=1 Tax=Stieleria sedimenti TaxID=2976331 RepID=UPI00217FF9B2|nr:hypothetical protein [Stieleria sedimenti]MCS7466538.1 hypothetical protein [Stieleria sedimenti]
MIRSPRSLVLSCLHTAVAALLAGPLLAQTPPFQAQEVGEPSAGSINASPEAFSPDLQISDPAQGDPLVDELGVEYLSHGPLHESYAEPYSADPKPAPVVPKEPPPPVKELPPTLRPESEKSTWIPGYWDWDEELGDFLWISGVWREVPPQRRWVPGYWEPAEDGYRRVAGFWANEQAATVDYLPPPPESLEQGPASPAPGDNYFYVPGNWNYQTSQYQWTPGFWARSQPNWVWIPNQYVWTPRGCIFRSGYWDYRLQRRGVLFTPVYYRSPIYLRANYWYRPRYVIDSGLGLLANLFVNPRYGRYYFGDYYGVGYGTSFHPWISYYQRPRRYDPLYSYYGIRSLHDREPSLDRIARQHQQIRDHQELRPPRTYSGPPVQAGQRGAGPAPGKGNRERVEMANLANPLEDYARRNSDDIRFRRISETQASSLGRFAEQSQEKTRQARRDFEKLPPGKKLGDPSVADRSGMPRGPSRGTSFRLPVDDVPQRGVPSSMRGRDVLNNDGRLSRDGRLNSDGKLSNSGGGNRSPTPEKSSPPVRQFGSPLGSAFDPSSGIGRSTRRDQPSVRSIPDLRSPTPGRSIPQGRSFTPRQTYTPRQSSPPTINRGNFGNRSDMGGLKASSSRGGDGGLKATGGGFGGFKASGRNVGRSGGGDRGSRGNAGSGGRGSKGKGRGK